ncbi:hypothetical protein G4L39_00395 [Limisphaera ngatamarikiensis]|uniref:Lipoprotein SmpA/OmlA domain-containing protein n=1 Tax=Limisphaera ngatamarikiensis TaxID=1324935 RepID=A0A6M1RM84_9BACT|nr:hypothetical protein [Limisphaera ngatamarikiensis]NGO37865.1 hypothetical protein [Limisphaera ngatamarikiensis]
MRTKPNVVRTGLALLCLSLWCCSCAISKVNWTERVGHYTFDQAVVEMGPPDKQAKLQDGTLVAEWLTRPGRNRLYTSAGWYPYWHSWAFPTYVETSSPDTWLRLVFGPDGRLKEWKTYVR